MSAIWAAKRLGHELAGSAIIRSPAEVGSDRAKPRPSHPLQPDTTARQVELWCDLGARWPMVQDQRVSDAELAEPAHGDPDALVIIRVPVWVDSVAAVGSDTGKTQRVPVLAPGVQAETASSVLVTRTLMTSSPEASIPETTQCVLTFTTLVCVVAVWVVSTLRFTLANDTGPSDLRTTLSASATGPETAFSDCAAMW